ncbi:MAG: helix-hairpin-helix domain-containing protein [Ferruginibacter sp.]|nr:helix-hairpin-helix domain-containing protein [Ferruginibacter sp.]
MRLSFVFIFFPFICFSQTPEVPTTTTEQQVENITQGNEDVETEDDSYMQQMQEFVKHPININTADEAQLNQLLVLSPIQIQNLLAYRQLMGNFVSIYELQAVPGMDVETLQKIRLYIIVSDKISLVNSFAERLSGGEHSVLLRVTQVLEKAKGFKLDASQATNFYQGSRQRIFLRYKYVYKNLLQYGLVGEKDAGEQFFKGQQKAGFDFYSVHFFARNIGIVKALALGDFTVNMGQGLTQWQSLAFRKSPDVTNIKRQASVLRPYNSAGEINFHRGVGITLGKKKWQGTIFGSYKNIDANFVADTSQTQDDFVSSLQTSGYHRTASEVSDKGVQRQIAVGGNFQYQINNLHVGVNAIQYQFKLPLQKDAEPYNKYALAGKAFGNYSVDYSYTFKNIHFFGEAAITQKKYTAFVQGMLLSAANNVDISLFYRNIQPSYQSLYTNAFTESTYPTNEKGLFAGISIKPAMAWKLDAYADFYSFPWLRYRVDAPTAGSDYLVQLTYKPNKQLEIYGRYRTESKSINVNPNELTLNPVIPQPRQNFRFHSVYKVSSSLSIRNRVELVWVDKKGINAEQGFLTYIDFAYKPALNPLSASIRLQYFETEGYNSRLYAYENDVLYSFSIPVFYEKGYRYYLNANYDIGKKATMWFRISQTINPDRTLIGSGLDEIKGNRKTEVKLQFMYRF